MLAVAGVGGILQLEVNGSRIDQFQTDEPIYLADRAINQALDGTNYLDIIIETREAEGLLKPQHLRRIEALQTYLETLPHVRGTTSIVDYLKQMNRAVYDGRSDAYQLPVSADVSAQYFLLYSMNGDPTDFEDNIDYDYRLANVRAAMDSGLYIDQKVVVEAAEAYIREQFNTPELSARLAGRVNVDYHWIHGLLWSHFRGLILAFIAVWIMGSLSFRSCVAGTLIMIPVSMSLLLIYAVMGFGGIQLSVGTSMFAAIAIGLSVDFAIHTVDRLVIVLRDQRPGLGDAFVSLLAGTGRALFLTLRRFYLALVSCSPVTSPR